MPVAISISMTVSQKSDISLTCKANFAVDLNSVPRWYTVDKDGVKQLCRPPLFSLEGPHYDMTTCTWITHMTLPRHQAKTVFCGGQGTWANYTLDTEGKAV